MFLCFFTSCDCPSFCRSHFVQSLKNILRQKLLYLGVNTTDILTAYITAIKALRILDPSGVLRELVCDPVRKYLRTRDDTVRLDKLTFFKAIYLGCGGSPLVRIVSSA